MKLFDKIKSIFQQPKIYRVLGSGISARMTSSSEFDGSKYPGGRANKTPVNLHNHYALRQQARQAMYDSVEARALVTSIVDTVVDVGLTWKPSPDFERLGITPEQSEEWARNIGNLFHLWAASKKSHRPRVNNFYQNQRLYQMFSQRDNDVFVRFFYGRDRDGVNPLQLDFVDPNQIRGDAYTSTYTQFLTNDKDDGIIRDSMGREIGYKIWNYDAAGKYTESTVPAVGEKSGRIMMIHGYNPEYAGQGRGYSKMSHLIQELSDLTDLKFSELQKAINQASVAAIIQNKEQAPSQPFAGRKVGVPVTYTEQQADAPTDASGEIAMNWTPQPEATIRQPGSWIVGSLKRGDEWINAQSTSPSAQFEKFYQFVCEYVAASRGWALEVVLKKFGQNYSASRGTLLLVWRAAQIERDEMQADFLDPIIEMWLSEEIASGRITAPGWNDPLLRAAWMSGTWAGIPIPNINPKDAAEADKLYLEMGAQTLDDVAENFNGSNGAANRAALVRQYEELPPAPWGKSQTQPEQNQNRGDENQ